MEKLDIYEYELFPGIIRIRVQNTSDPELVDILSGIERAGGSIYVDGLYFSYLNKYSIYSENDKTYLELHVIQTA